MFWKFVKTHWFVIALALLVLAALARKNGRGIFGRSVRQEKYTEQRDSAAETAQMGILPESGAAVRDLPAISQATATAFLKRFGAVSVAEHKKYGVPASIVLGIAYVNSFAGQREVARSAKNYFALPCGSEWEGSNIELGGKCFRRYETAWEGFRDFSLYLQAREWMSAAKSNNGQDWQAWVTFLAEQPVSDVRHFEKELKTVIEAYRLYELDEKSGH